MRPSKKIFPGGARSSAGTSSSNEHFITEQTAGGAVVEQTEKNKKKEILTERQFQDALTSIRRNDEKSVELTIFAGQEIDDAKAVSIAEALKENTHIKKIDLTKNNIQANGMKALSEVFGALESLEELYLSDNTLTEGLNFLAKALAINRNIQVLELDNTNMGDPSFYQLMHGAHKYKSLRRLSLARNKLTHQIETFISVFEEFAHLEYLNMAGALGAAVCGNQVASKIASVLGKNQALVFLDLSSNRIKNYGAGQLASHLQYNHSLLHLNLDKNEICDNGAEFLASMLTINESLEVLSLNNNSISEQGMESLNDALNENWMLYELQLNHNTIETQYGERLFKEIVQKIQFKKNAHMRYKDINKAFDELRKFDEADKEDREKERVLREENYEDLELSERQRAELSREAKLEEILQRIMDRTIARIRHKRTIRLRAERGRELNDDGGYFFIARNYEVMGEMELSKKNYMKIRNTSVFYSKRPKWLFLSDGTYDGELSQDITDEKDTSTERDKIQAEEKVDVPRETLSSRMSHLEKVQNVLLGEMREVKKILFSRFLSREVSSSSELNIEESQEMKANLSSMH